MIVNGCPDCAPGLPCERCAKAALAAEARIASMEKENADLRQQLSEAAMRINCAGPVAHRIDVLRAQLSDALAAAEQRAASAEALSRRLQQELDQVKETLTRGLTMEMRADPPVPHRNSGDACTTAPERKD